jgi:endonuclease/exonuclease/phosphatase family metal-dependent hydrolase
MKQTILFSNIGYAKGIDGSLWQHIRRFNRHFYSSVALQQTVLSQLQTIIHKAQPDICCFVEVDQGSWHAARFQQLQFLAGDLYEFHDSADKYGPSSRLGRMPMHSGKSNGFIAKSDIPFERLYLTHGTKRLFYKLMLSSDIDVIFGHFSLQAKIRARQFTEIGAIMRTNRNPVILLGDFNILRGFNELDGLLADTGLHLLNEPDEHTFTFHTRRLVLDLCLCSPELKNDVTLQIIPQRFSDHAALLIEINRPEA